MNDQPADPLYVIRCAAFCEALAQGSRRIELGAARFAHTCAFCGARTSQGPEAVVLRSGLSFSFPAVCIADACMDAAVAQDDA